jgi:hypothetical protein
VLQSGTNTGITLITVLHTWDIMGVWVRAVELVGKLIWDRTVMPTALLTMPIVPRLYTPMGIWILKTLIEDRILRAIGPFCIMTLRGPVYITTLRGHMFPVYREANMDSTRFR